MSADNGIYILPTQELDNGIFTGKFEYRVAYAQAIDNIDYIKEFDNIHLLYEVLLFGNSNICHSLVEARKRAEEIYSEIKKQGPFYDFILEYGICELSERQHPFPEMTIEEAKSKLDDYWGNYRKKRKREKKKITENIDNFLTKKQEALTSKFKIGHEVWCVSNSGYQANKRTIVGINYDSFSFRFEYILDNTSTAVKEHDLFKTLFEAIENLSLK